MKKIILPLLTLLLVFTSCQKEDDLLTPITPPDTNICCDSVHIDTTNSSNDSTNNVVTVLPPSNTFVGFGKSYNITMTEFDMNCSELTTSPVDTSYSYTTYNQGRVTFLVHDTLVTTSYPLNGNASPRHAYMYGPEELDCIIRGFNYTPGILTLDLRLIFCNGTQIIDWTVDMVVTEYSNGNLDLSINNSGNHMGISWDSQLKIQLEPTN